MMRCLYHILALLLVQYRPIVSLSTGRQRRPRRAATHNYKTTAAAAGGDASHSWNFSSNQKRFGGSRRAFGLGRARGGTILFSENSEEDEPRSNCFAEDARTDTARRRCILSAAAVPLAYCRGEVAGASEPLTSADADNVQARIERSLRPKPSKIIRPRLNLDFAVTLMRSSYNAVDSLDIVSMQQFQRDFFLIRQAEYKPYSEALGAGAMIQGDLTDPNYFDFISFAQYNTILRELVDPPLIFTEQIPVEVGDDEPQRFDSIVVKRDPSLTSADLIRRHSDLVGTAIIDKLIEKFGKTASAIPYIETERPSGEKLLQMMKQLVNLFLVQGFAFDGSAAMATSSAGDASGAQVTITFNSPAILWSGQSLQAKKAKIVNDFALKASRALMRRVGYEVVGETVKYAQNNELTTFTLR